FHSGELESLNRAQTAVDANGVAFFLIDANLIKDGQDDAEEVLIWRQRKHSARKPVAPPGPWHHSRDDSFPPDHSVVYLVGLTPPISTEEDKLTLRLGSWGREFEISGTAASFGEYLYAVVTGRP